jgi:hypothetical protein
MIVDQKVIDAIERRGFRRDAVNPVSIRWLDEHGHMLTELQLLDETPESIGSLIDWLHPT